MYMFLVWGRKCILINCGVKQCTQCMTYFYLVYNVQICHELIINLHLLNKHYIETIIIKLPLHVFYFPDLIVTQQCSLGKLWYRFRRIICISFMILNKQRQYCTVSATAMFYVIMKCKNFATDEQTNGLW